MSLKALIEKGFVFFDGAMGTMLQEKGLQPGEIPEAWNEEHAEIIIEIHRSYYDSGANIATANTFGANPIKTSNYKAYITSAICNAKKAKYSNEQFVALDIGPTGKLLKPLGDLDFEKAYDAFSEVVKCGVEAGADLILIETMNDPYEMKAAVLAAKEHSKLPVFATFVLDERGKTITGCDVPSMIALLEGLGVDALGVNCSLGAKQLKSFLPQLLKYSSVPVIVNPNAGMPMVFDNKTVFDSTPEDFVREMKEIALAGARILGGCCGTTPSHIKALIEKLKGTTPKPIEEKEISIVSSYAKSCEFGEKVILIGERINPTGKPKLKAALRENNIDYLVGEALGQEENGANMLDVNVGLPEIDEKNVLQKAIKEIQSVTTLPLQIDTSNKEALECAMRIYNGKPLVNSVNGEKSSMEAVFPLLKKYGGMVVALTLDEKGIPETAKERFEIAKKIIKEAQKYGIKKKDIIFDTLCLTVSSNMKAPSVTLDAMKMIKEKLGAKVSLGISNISFGLPKRDFVNSTFFTMALTLGLDAVIMNPYSEEMMKAYYSFNALSEKDLACENYICFASDITNESTPLDTTKLSLQRAIEKGLKSEAKDIATMMLSSCLPLEIVSEHIIPALNKVGSDYEDGRVYLPQLLMSAEAATEAFSVVKNSMSDENETINGEVIIATVKGDIHDIGKNIVKVILQNYGFKVYDLGKDVSPEEILSATKKYSAKIVGLSALMTTTVTAMENTIKLIKQNSPDVKIMVGGAVLNESYALKIGADKYAKDAMDAVRFAQEIYKK